MKTRIAISLSALLLILFAANLAMAQGRTYLGAEKCGKLCHKVEFTSWAASKHASAFKNLKPEDQGKKECYDCHVTAGNKDMPGVQCEHCHGAGSEYSKLPIMKDKAKAAAAGLLTPKEPDCVKCHNKKSPTFKGFTFAEAVKKVHDKKPKA